MPGAATATSHLGGDLNPTAITGYGDFAFELHEWQGLFTANRHGPGAGAAFRSGCSQRDCADCTGPFIGGNFYGHGFTPS
jgi:hypothetical protein